MTDHSWFDAIDLKKEDGTVFFASGVFYYLKTEDICRLFCAMAEHFPSGRLVFDATNATGLKNMLKTRLKPSEMENVGQYFSVEDEQELQQWSKNFASVMRKGYMAGYRPSDKRYGFLANMIFRFGDKRKMCQVIEIEFRS